MSTADPSPAKRRRTNRHSGEDGYQPGNIVEIELHNFMTYEHLRCEPAPRLNLVIGPNGSGKSSIVCAIALGLAGDPQTLGRASSVGAFVKRGEDSGFVKITLRGDTAASRIVIMRKINTENKSDWLLNGSTMSKRDIIQVIRKYNIQVNNLTQFLPQDRVCEFAKLTPTQLLEETEKAVGNPELSNQHFALIEKSRVLKKLELMVKQNGDSLNQLEALNAEQERDVGRVRQREQLLSQVETMRKKLPWLRYDMKKMEYMEVQRVEKEAKRKLDEAAKILNEISAPIQEQKNAKSDQEAICKKINTKLNQNPKKRMEVLDSEGHLCAQVRAKYAEIEELKRSEASRKQRIIQATEDLAAAEMELANLPIYDPPRDEVERLNTEIMNLEVAANQRKLQMTEKEGILFQKRTALRQCLDRLKESENKNLKLLQALRNSGAERIFEAYEWLQAHRNELRKEVYGPVLLEVNLNDRTHAPYLENHIPNYIWKSVITQDSSDRDFLVKNLNSFDIPVLNYVRDGRSSKASFEVPRELRDLGIYTRLDQVFDAPSAVREILTSQSSIANSYIGTRETDQWADKLAKLGILDFWTPESHYRWSISRYGGHISASVDPVHPSRLFLCSSDVGDVENVRTRTKELEDAVTELEESVKALKREQRQLDDDASKLHKQREEIINTIRYEKKKRRDMESRIDQKRRKLESMKNEDDIDSNTKKLLEQVVQFNARRFKIAMQFKDLLIEAVSYKWSFAEKNMTLIEIDSRIAELEADFKQHQKVAIQASTHFEQCKAEGENFRQQLASAKRHAESVAIITKQLAQEFLNMPTTVEELEAAIQDTTSQANSILFVNQNILEEYEGRQLKIDGIKSKLEADKIELERCLSEIDTLKDSWLPTLRGLVAKINETFSRNFQEMAVAGEVSLDEHETDFDKYGILIKVKFRQGSQLQVLSAHHQSGGERSVSTILYLVSLQDLTNCPFRVVDEINQGMDLVNERKMFQQLVRAASQVSTPQCFLLTPKLLDNLEYSDACSILNIMNGPWIKEATEVWKSGKCWRRITGLEGQC